MKLNTITKYLLLFITIMVFSTANVFAQATTPTTETKETESKPWENEVKGWKIKDFQPYIKAMRDIGKLSNEYSEIILKLAIDEFSTGIDILEDMENEVIKMQDKNLQKRNLNEKWYWQEVDRKEQEKRQIRMMKIEAKTKSITYFVMAINHLDEIKSQIVIEKPEFTNFKKRLYQVFVSTQYDLHNFLSCIPILERYIALDDEARADVWAYTYLSNCYSFMETLLCKSRNMSEEKIMLYRQKKNRSLLMAAELQYGVESVEYKHLQELVEQDEKKSERLNDFK